MSLKRILHSVLDIIFPSCCISCGKRGPEFCLECISQSRAAERESEIWIFPIFDYRHPPLKKAVHALKYKGNKRIARIFAEVLYSRMVEELSDLDTMENFRDPILVPIPLSAKRKRERGYNQAELMCDELLNIHLRHSVDWKLSKNILYKPKDTIHQAHIENRSARLKNVIGSFAIKNNHFLQGRNIILIDDVTTTGATLSEARKMLKRAGARRIIAFTIAH